MASWDVLGVYPESTNSEGSYKDEDILAAAQAYNKAVRAALDKQSARSDDSSASQQAPQREAEMTEPAKAPAAGPRAEGGSPSGTKPGIDEWVTMGGPEGAPVRVRVVPASG
jgi:hypothetical protein